jgi:hypothetical protein
MDGNALEGMFFLLMGRCPSVHSFSFCGFLAEICPDIFNRNVFVWSCDLFVGKETLFLTVLTGVFGRHRRPLSLPSPPQRLIAK